MCRFISLFHCPTTGEVQVSDLNSHGNTENKLKLDTKVWREGHYLPDGKIELRLKDSDRVDRVEYETAFRNRFPTFSSFFNWAITKTIDDKGKFHGSLYLRGLTSAKDLVLPKTVGGSLDLSGLTSAKDLVLPKTVGGYLDLSGLTSAKDLVLPKTVGGSLYLRGLTSAKDLVLPKTVGGSLYLSGLTSAKDLVLPKTVGGPLYLRGEVRGELNQTKGAH